MRRVSTSLLAAALLFSAPPRALAETPEVVYSENFQTYSTQKSPSGWVDTSVGGSGANGIFMTLADPVANGNIAFGTKQASGKPGTTPRIGTFSTYTSKSFAGEKRFEYRGRFLRTDAGA